MLTKTLARDVMISPVLSVREDHTVHELVTFLTENSISGAPVLDARGKLVGVVSVADIAEDEPLSSRRHDGRPRRVSDIMTPTFFTVPDDTPASEIAKTMVAGQIHRLLVTRDAQIVGIVSALDLLKLVTGPATRKGSRGPASASAGTSAPGGRAARTSATASKRPRPRPR